ncbi:uncharacterized protein RAG0_09286 [Rhynchosporium agropyri]|uniref:Uncharacterized protein n=1 Tax=Rhynchosporium agropyri TaxID=914238 RepID=A0A1E1KUT3_9HELO|nr:uncharacterized protein RAG0_09286 [Rhynchosporium agropyri]
MDEKDQKTDIHTTMERQYYATGSDSGSAFVERSVAPHEFRSGYRGVVHVPFHNKERLQNGAHCLTFIRENTDVPVPDLLGLYEERGSWYLRTSFVKGVTLSQLFRRRSSDGDSRSEDARRYTTKPRKPLSRGTGRGFVHAWIRHERM